jgi:SAM-dependent methyltransferase
VTASRIPWWAILRDPAFIARRRLSAAVAAFAADPALRGGLLVDVGCGSKPYEAYFQVDRYVGVDVEESGHPEADKRCDLVYDGARLPLADGDADSVLCTQVLEHAPDPAALLAEIGRILKPGGHLLLTAPFLWEEHERPFDFQRFTSFGIARLVEGAGFTLLRQHRTSGSVEALAQLGSVYLHREIGRGVPVWSSVVTLVLCAPLQALGLLFGWLLPDVGHLFLDSAVLAVKPEGGE